MNQQKRSLESVRKALGNIRDATKTINEQTPLAFPVGMIVYYHHGSRLREVEVVGHTMWGYVKVKGKHSSEYKIEVEKLFHIS